MSALDRDLAGYSRLAQQTSGRVPARRLTKEEYKYTLQDLLAIDGAVTDQLPDESDSGSFDTVNSTQRLSGLHVDGFLRAAEEALGVDNDYLIHSGRSGMRVDVPVAARHLRPVSRDLGCRD